MRNWLDKIGVGLSGLCLVHCLVLPFVILFVPTLAASFVSSEWTHLVLVTIALPISLIAFWRGTRCHKGVRPFLLGLAGLALMISGVVLAVEDMTEVALTVTGATLLALGHLSNHRLSARTTERQKPA